MVRGRSLLRRGPRALQGRWERAGWRGGGWGRIRLVPREAAYEAAGTTWRPRGVSGGGAPAAGPAYGPDGRQVRPGSSGQQGPSEGAGSRWRWVARARWAVSCFPVQVGFRLEACTHLARRFPRLSRSPVSHPAAQSRVPRRYPEVAKGVLSGQTAQCWFFKVCFNISI